MVKLVHGNQPVVEHVHAEFVHGEAECRMGADQRFVAAFEECRKRVDLAAVVSAGRVAEIPARFDALVGPESRLGQRLVVEARADGFFRHDDDGLFDPLILKLVERDEHERPAFAGGRGGDLMSRYCSPRFS